MSNTTVLETDFTLLTSSWKKSIGIGGSMWDPHPAKAELLRLGEHILPLVIEDLRKTHWYGWLCILPVITGMDIIPDHHKGDSDVMVWDWIAWYTFIYRMHKT